MIIRDISIKVLYSFFPDCATEPESSMVGCHELAWMRVLWFHHCRMLPKEYDDVRLRLHPDMSMTLTTFIASSMHGVSSRIWLIIMIIMVLYAWSGWDVLLDGSTNWQRIAWKQFGKIMIIQHPWLRVSRIHSNGTPQHTQQEYWIFEDGTVPTFKLHGSLIPIKITFCISHEPLSENAQFIPRASTGPGCESSKDRIRELHRSPVRILWKSYGESRAGSSPVDRELDNFLNVV